MDLKLQRLDQGEKIAAGSAAALFVCMFLGWFNFGFSVLNAWDSLHYISPLLAIAIAATLAIVLLKASGRDLDAPDGTVIFILGCVAVLFVLFRLIDPVSASEASSFGGGDGTDLGSSPAAGIFLSLIAAAGMALGGHLATGGQARVPSAKASVEGERRVSIVSSPDGRISSGPVPAQAGSTS